MALETKLNLGVPYYTFQSLWSFPGVSKLPIGYERLSGINAYDRKVVMLENYGTPELNNEGGLFAPATDFGTLGLFVFWCISGYAAAKLFKAYLAGSIEGLALYPIFFLAILEVPRFLYVSNQRVFPALVALCGLILTTYFFNLRSLVASSAASPSSR